MSHPFDALSRQRRLPEVGGEGQARLEQAELRVARHAPGADIELSYLQRSGVRQAEFADDLPPLPFVHESAFQYPGPQNVAAGAWRALVAIKQHLGLTPSGDDP